MAPVKAPVCEVCGEPQQRAGICSKCQVVRPAYHALRSCSIYKEPVRPALIRLKYHHDLGLGEAMAWNLAEYLDSLHWRADFVICIPLSKQRFAERGYNQVELLARPLARLMDWRYLSNVLERTRHTSSQVGLGVDERRKNVAGAFTAQSQCISGKTVLLVDDVTTTGSTINAASIALRSAGVKSIYALTFAKAVFAHGSDYHTLVKSYPRT